MARALATTVLVVLLATGCHREAQAAAHGKATCRPMTAGETMEILKTAAGCTTADVLQKKAQETTGAAEKKGCSCSGTNKAEQVECPAKSVTQWDSLGKKCVAAVPDKDKDWNKHTWMYAADYGASCKSHAEPGSYDCTKVVGQEAAHTFDATNAAYNTKMDSAGWCTQVWCYVDPCACDKTDLAKSSWFSGYTLYYSYEQCGATGSFNAALCDSGTSETACTALASCKWAVPAATEEASEAAGAFSQASIVPGLGLVLVLSTLLH